MITVIQGGLLELDNKLANAIQGLIGGELNLPDPINPMQQMIMNLSIIWTDISIQKGMIMKTQLYIEKNASYLLTH